MAAPFVTKANGESVEEAGTAAYAEKCGVAHLVCKDDQDALTQTRTLLSLLPINNLSMVPQFEYEEDPAGADTLLQYMMNEESCTCKAVKAIADASSVLLLQKEFGKGVVTALGTLAGSTVGFAATKGKKLTSDDSAKLARFVRTCDAFSIPVVTLVNTDGFVPSSKAELAGSIRESAKLAHAYAEATCPKIALITGDAVGSAYIALAGKGANADMVMAWPSAMISALAPDAAVEILWHEKLAGLDKAGREQLTEEYKNTLASPLEAAKNGYIDQIFEPDQTRAYLIGALDMLSGKRVSKMPKKHGNMPL